MHTCSTSTSPPSSVQQVGWRDRLDLQRDGAVQVVESFCSRASPTRSWEGETERRAAGRLGLRGRCGGVVHPSPLYIEGWAPTLTPPPSPRPAAKRGRSGGQGNPPLLEGPIRVYPLLGR